jgi:hypothetical protein
MTDTQGMVRLNLDFSLELNHILEELASKIGVNKSDVVRQTITLMQIIITAKEQTKKLGITEADELIVTEIITPLEAEPKAHPLETFMEKFAAWEDEGTTEEIIQDIYDSRTNSNSEYIL